MINYAANSQSAAQANLVTAIEELGSGQSINFASDNPAGLAESTSYSVELSSTAKSMSNVQEGLSLLDTASVAANQINTNLENINTLVAQAGDGALSSEDRDSIQTQINQLTQNIDQLAASTQFNGHKLLDGSGNNISLQSGPNASDRSTISIGNLSSASLGIAGLDVTTKAGQTAASTSINNAIQKVNDQNATIGATQGSITSTLSNLGASYSNLAVAQSQISSTDYAAESANFAQASTINLASLKGIALYNSIQGNMLGLLPK